MAITLRWEDFYFYLKAGHLYKIMFYDRTNRITRTEEGFISGKGRVGIEFEVIEDNIGITTTNIRYKDIRAAQEIV